MDETTRNHHLVRLEDYEQYVGAAAVERILKKAEKLHGYHVVHVNSTYYGGGVATMLSPLTSLMNRVGIKTGWRVIQGSPDFFGITKKIHNALQRRAAVVLQKSLREGFGLTVAEAMWKGTPVIGGNVGGIRHQIEDGVNGFLVSSVEQAAARIVQLVKDESLRRQMGARGREVVKARFLMSRLLEQYLDLFGSFETIYRLRPAHGLTDAVQGKA